MFRRKDQSEGHGGVQRPEAGRGVFRGPRLAGGCPWAQTSGEAGAG